MNNRLKSFSKKLKIGIYILVFGSTFSFTYSQQSIVLKILDNSNLYLEGKSNINKFSCYCEENFPTQEIQFNGVPTDGKAHFNKTEIQITTAKLNCGKKAINKDLAKALKAEQYPKITLELCSLTFSEAAHTEEWQHVQAETFMTIAGTTRSLSLTAKAKQIEDEKFMIKSSTEIKMTDFGIDPPTALLGLVKVKDTIVLTFDLSVKIELGKPNNYSQR